MSTVERRGAPVLPPLTAGDRLDQPAFHERYQAMPPMTRAELVGGIVLMPSPLSFDHGETSVDVAGWLFHYRRKTPGVRGANDATVILSPRGEPQPDTLLFIPAQLGGQARINAAGYLEGAPELVVEIGRSSRHLDLNAKKSDYEQAGVREYLFIGLDPDEVRWFQRGRRGFTAQPAGPDAIFRSQVFPGLWLDPEALFAADLDRLIHALDQGINTPEHAAFAAQPAAATH